MDSNLRAENRMLKEQLEIIVNENEKLKEIVENLTTMTVCGDRKQIKNTAQYKLELAEQKINKAIEYIKMYDKKSNDLIFTMKASDDLLIILGDKE